MDKWGDQGAYEGCDDDTMAAGFESTCPGWREPVKWEIAEEARASVSLAFRKDSTAFGWSV